MNGRFFIFWFLVVYCLVRCLDGLVRCLGDLILPSPFLDRRRPRCLIGGCLGATVGVAVDRAEDRAERGPNIRNKSSIFRYRGAAYLTYRSSVVR